MLCTVDADVVEVGVRMLRSAAAPNAITCRKDRAMLNDKLFKPEAANQAAPEMVPPLDLAKTPTKTHPRALV
jgi:hypothetical protein